jgi:hypothetical protein
MPFTERDVLPELLMVKVRLEELLIITLPNARLPLKETILVVGTTPRPDAAMLGVPLVASELTRILPP